MLTCTESQGHSQRPSGKTAGANGLDEQPRDVPMPQGDDPTRFNWRVDLRDNTYKYERLVWPVGSDEQAGGKDTPHRTIATLNLQPIRLPTRWSDEPLSIGGGPDRGNPAIREHTRYMGPADSPVSHHNIWDRAVTQLMGYTASSVYDGGGERVPETPQDIHEGRSCGTQPKAGTSSSV